MAVSTIDGTVEEAVLKRSRRNLRVYERIEFRLPTGSSKTWQKADGRESVAALIRRGRAAASICSPRSIFAASSAVRDDKGGAAFTFPKNNETAMMIFAIMGVVLTALLLAIGYVSLWPILLMVLGVPMYFVYRSTRLAEAAQYGRDAGYRPPPAPAAA